jgi:hypothetical protein
MAEAARAVLATAGYGADIAVQEDTSALQAGAALVLFVDLAGGSRLGADRAGAPRRRAEAIGQYVAQHLVEDLRTGATLDRHAADQLIPFAALAAGESRFRIPQLTEHVESNAWLAQVFLGAKVSIAGQMLSITGVGMGTPWATATNKEERMGRQVWAYHNAFGWYAVDPEQCQYDRAQVDTLPALLEADTKHALMAKAEAAGYEIVMWLE